MAATYGSPELADPSTSPLTPLGALSTELELPWVPTDCSAGQMCQDGRCGLVSSAKPVSHHLESGQGSYMLTKALAV